MCETYVRSRDVRRLKMQAAQWPRADSDSGTSDSDAHTDANEGIDPGVHEEVGRQSAKASFLAKVSGLTLGYSSDFGCFIQDFDSFA